MPRIINSISIQIICKLKSEKNDRGGYFWIFLEISRDRKKIFFFSTQKKPYPRSFQTTPPQIETIISTVPCTALIYSDLRPLYISLYSLHRFVKI